MHCDTSRSRAFHEDQLGLSGFGTEAAGLACPPLPCLIVDMHSDFENQEARSQAEDSEISHVGDLAADVAGPLTITEEASPSSTTKGATLGTPDELEVSAILEVLNNNLGGSGKFHCITKPFDSKHIYSARVGDEYKRISRWKAESTIILTVIKTSFPSKKWASFTKRALLKAIGN